MQENPIGIFDSGVGGLTVANAIHQLLPGENLLYFGDTVHLPYGDKSRETIAGYSARITEYLLEQSCKAIVIACNTASANAYDEVVRTAAGKAHVIDVINPVVEFILQQTSYKHIGVIGTKGTINSGTYVSKIIAGNPHLNVSSLATPMLVPMIEEGFIFDDISNAIIRTYLSKPEISSIEALILGCTHYPIIRNQISKYYNFAVDVIDSSRIVASHLREILTEKNLLSPSSSGTCKFLVSDYTDYFQAISKLFFDESLKLEKVSLWN
ncbi:MAG: glutamate racemase [Bacteroidales bacterium]|nr:glutamate racemase [Bacteroidales bacterium]MBN2763591.1 glutamate racemase [Bacteroidales bacterium]